MKDPGRIWLRHDPPPWIDPAASNYFITICCQTRGTNQLCCPGVGEALLHGARIYHEQHKWCPSLLLLMPDHLHVLVSFGREYGMVEVIGQWKRYAARKFGVQWQRNFFEHRLRSAESAEEKAAYILQNPVRAGLMAKGGGWPFTLMLD